MKKWFLLLPLLLMGGCFFTAYQPTYDYDLVLAPVKSGQLYQVNEFRNESSSGNRFRLLNADGLVEGDPYHSWVLSPGGLVARSLNLALNDPDNSGKRTTVDGRLIAFEVDKSAKVFHLSGFYRKDKGPEVFFDIREPLADFKPESIVKAASLAVGQLADRIAQ